MWEREVIGKGVGGKGAYREEEGAGRGKEEGGGDKEKAEGDRAKEGGREGGRVS